MRDLASYRNEGKVLAGVIAAKARRQIVPPGKSASFSAQVEEARRAVRAQVEKETDGKAVAIELQPIEAAELEKYPYLKKLSEKGVDVTARGEELIGRADRLIQVDAAEDACIAALIAAVSREEIEAALSELRSALA